MKNSKIVLGIFDNPILEEHSLIIPGAGFMLLYSDGAQFDDVTLLAAHRLV